MGSAGRAAPWIRATSKGFGFIAAFSPLVQRPVRCAGVASAIRPHYSREVATTSTGRAHRVEVRLLRAVPGKRFPTRRIAAIRARRPRGAAGQQAQLSASHFSVAVTLKPSTTMRGFSPRVSASRSSVVMLRFSPGIKGT